MVLDRVQAGLASNRLRISPAPRGTIHRTPPLWRAAPPRQECRFAETLEIYREGKSAPAYLAQERKRFAGNGDRVFPPVQRPIECDHGIHLPEALEQWSPIFGRQERDMRVG